MRGRCMAAGAGESRPARRRSRQSAGDAAAAQGAAAFFVEDQGVKGRRAMPKTAAPKKNRARGTDGHGTVRIFTHNHQQYTNC